MKGVSGSASFLFVAAILPLVFLALAMGSDLSGYLREAAALQTAADRAALYSFRYLPNADEARAAALSFTRVSPGVAAAVEAGHGFVQVRLSAEFALSFGGFFRGGVAHLWRLPLEASAAARGIPRDVFVAIDAGRYLAPMSGAWGTADEWPAAALLRDRPELRTLDGVTIDGRAATQRCFNPVLSLIKEAAILAYSVHAGTPYDAAGVGFYPAGAEDLEIVRPLRPPGEISPGSGEVRFVRGQSGFASSGWCAAIAERETLAGAADRYAFPAAPRVEQGFNPSGSPLSRILPGTLEFDPAYQSSLSVREAVWMHPVQFESVGNMPSVLIEAASAAVGGTSVAAGAMLRAGLASRAEKKLIVLAGDVPWARDGSGSMHRFPDPFTTAAMIVAFDQIRGWLEAQPDLRFSLFYVMLDHQGAPGASIQAWEATIRGYLAALPESVRPRFHAVVAHSSDRRRFIEVLGAVLADGNAALISR